MRIYRLLSTAVGGVFMASISTAAFAGCGAPGFNGNVQNCNPHVIAHPGLVDRPAPIHTYERMPYGHLKSFAYKNTPNVNITRLHSRAPFVSLNDRPVGFTQGCTPTSTVYCRGAGQPAPQPIAQPAGRPVSVTFNPTPAPQPYIAPPVPMPPVQAAPINDGGYWEKTSGPSIVDGLPSTQILCRRAAPQYAPRPIPRPRPVTVQVVRPVIGVPVPVPTPVPYPIYTPRPHPMPVSTCGGFQGPVMAGGPRPHPHNSRYGNRWAY